jgi:hypothetical protein
MGWVLKRAFVFLTGIFLVGIFAVFVSSQPASGQATSGRVVGTVFDQQRSVVPDAKVAAVNTATQIKATTTTRGDGTFEVPNLPIGTYRVEVEKDGFEKAVTQEKKLEINQSVQFDVTLALGETTQTVNVEATVSAVETANPTVGGTIVGEAIQQAPLNGRDALSLALLQPGVSEGDPTDTGAGSGTHHALSIAGGRTDSVTFLLDGSLNNNLLNNAVVFNPNPDTISEFRVLESNYTAEYGRNGGGIITEVTKSGANQWHGSAYDYLRNGDLDANSYFGKLDGQPRDPLRRNQYGGTFGGPVRIPHLINGKDKFFFFVGYQGQKQSDQATPTESSVPVPTTAEAAGDFSKSGPGGGPDPGVTCFLTGLWHNTGNPMEPDGSSCGTPANPFYEAATQPAACSTYACALDPTKFNPVAVKYIATGLLPTSANGLVAPTGSATNNVNELTMRFDYQITQKDQLSATIGGQRNPALSPFGTASSALAFADVPGYSVTNRNNDYFVNLAYTRAISANKLNELRFGTQRLYTVQAVPTGSSTQDTTKSLGFVNFTPDNPTGPPLIDFNDGATTLGYTYLGPSTLVNNTFSGSDTFTWIRGNHSWKMGGGFSGYQNNQQFDFVANGFYDFDGTLTGNDFADFLLGAPTDFEQGPAAPSNIRTKATDGFLQDEWRATKRLTLTLGVRYEYNSPKYDTEGRTFSIVPGDQSTRFVNAPVGLVFPGDKGAPNGANFPDKDDWAPRLGFAWNPDGRGNTSIRGGFGMFYDVLKAEDNFQFNGQLPFFSSSFFSFPSSLAGNSGCPASDQAGQKITYFSDPYDSMCVTNPFPSKPPTSNLNFAAAGFLPFGGGSSFFVDPHLRTPYTYQYNMSLQHELVPSLSMEINYVGSSSHGLTGLEDANPFILGTTNRVLNLTPGNSSCQDASGNSTSGVPDTATCSFGAINEFRNVANANYNAMTASLTKRTGNTTLGNIYFTLGYTYGHSIDNVSGFRQRNDGFVPTGDPGRFRASSDFDVKNRIVFSGGWDLPFDRAWSSGPKRLTQGWSLFPILTWRSGFPLDVFANLPDESGSFSEGPSGLGDIFLTRANEIGPTNTFNPKVMRDFGSGDGNYWFDPNSFTNAQCGDSLHKGACTPGPSIFPSDTQVVNNPSLATYGSTPRNFMRGPGAVNLDLSVAKTTVIAERLSLEIRADFFNFFNHAEFSNPDTDIQDVGSTFGEVLNTGVPSDPRPRIIQLAARLSF